MWCCFSMSWMCGNHCQLTTSKTALKWRPHNAQCQDSSALDKSEILDCYVPISYSFHFDNKFICQAIERWKLQTLLLLLFLNKSSDTTQHVCYRLYRREDSAAPEPTAACATLQCRTAHCADKAQSCAETPMSLAPPPSPSNGTSLPTSHSTVSKHNPSLSWCEIFHNLHFIFSDKMPYLLGEKHSCKS